MTERGREKVNERREGRRKQGKEEGKEKGGKKRKRNICLYYACVFPSMNTVVSAKKSYFLLADSTGIYPFPKISYFT